MGRLFNSS